MIVIESVKIRLGSAPQKRNDNTDEHTHWPVCSMKRPPKEKMVVDKADITRVSIHFQSRRDHVTKFH